MKWIRTEDRLPGRDDVVLAIVRGCLENVIYHDAYDFAFYDSTEKRWTSETFPEMEITVSHWMPLPLMPEELLEETEKWIGSV